MTRWRARACVPVWIWLAALLLCAMLIGRARFTADLSAFLPRAPTEQQALLVDQLRDGVASRLILVGIQGADASSRAALSKAMVARLRGAGLFSTVSNGEAMTQERDRAFLFDHRYQLSPAMTPAHFSVAGLRAAIGDTLDLLASPAGLLIKSIVPRDPTGEFSGLLEQFAGRTGEGVERPRKADGVWVSPDGRRALLLLQTRAAGSDTDGQQQAIGAVRAAFTAAQHAGAVPALSATLLMTGPGVFAVHARDLIKGEVTRLAALSLILIVTLLLMVYRSLRTLGLGLLPVLSGAMAGVAAVSLGFGTVHGITLGFGTTLIGEAVDYSIYLFVQSERTQACSREWRRDFWPTIRLGVLTSVFGFASLLLSGFPGLAQLGLYSISGLLAAALVTRFVLPVLLPADFRVRDLSALGRRLAWLAQRAGAWRWSVVALVLAAAAVLALHRQTLWSHQLSALSPVPTADQALDASLRSDLGAPDVRYLVAVTGSSQERVLRASESVVTALQPLVQANAIAGVDSPTTFLPSVATQQARVASLPAPAELKDRLRQALDTLPIRLDRLAPFLADAQAARQMPPVTRADLDGTSFAVAVDGMLLHHAADRGEPERWTAFLPLHAPVAKTGSTAIDPSVIRHALAGLDVSNAGSEILLVDVKGEADRLYSGYLHQALVLSLAGLAAIVALLGVALRSLECVLRVLAPLVGAVLTVAAALALAGQQLTILHLVGLLLIVAVGSNYALFFNRRSGPPGTDGATAVDPGVHGGITPRTLASLLLANLTTVAGFGVLAFSSVPVLHAIGITVGPGAILALLFSAVFAKRQAPIPAAEATA